ncbi:MAG: zinc-ribbon domain-containing protein [Clostridiales bacterium]|nr:zinc-ribbon domain-containing protein [Clostridiales bacterium]
MGFFKKQLLEVIEWQDDSKDTIVYRFPMQKREEIMNSSTLVVRPSQTAVFVHKGQICDIFAPGTYKLATENIPFLTKLLSLPTGFNSPIKAEVYFINTKQFTGLKWGTQNPIMMRDADFGNVRLRGFGTYSFKIVDVRTFMEEVFGTNQLYKVEDIESHNRPLIIQGITDALGEGKISALDLAANYKELADEIKKQTNVEFLKLGMKLSGVVVENISLPEEIEKALDERTRLGIMEDRLDTNLRLKAADAMDEAAKNPNGSGLAGLGVGLGAGSSLGQVFAEGLKGSEEKPKKKKEEKVCAKCKTNIPANAKFCPECGVKIPAKSFCPECGAEVKSTAKFCSECGNKLGE